MVDMMTQMCAGGGWLLGTFAILAVVVLILAAGALIKYLVTGQQKQAAP